MVYDLRRWQIFAGRMIDQYGELGSIRPAGGSDTPAKFVWLDYDDQERDGDIIRDTDRRVMVRAKELAAPPTSDDMLVAAEGEFRIVTVRPIAPSGIKDAIAFLCQVRA